ncbi:MAG: hypothetical protein AMXMBFR64_56770 [Myxococcales bacterium]
MKLNTMSCAVTIAAMLLHGACEQDKSTVADTAAGNAGGGTGDTGLSSDVSAQGPDSGCKNLAKMGDYKVFGDECWDPPEHYCSQGCGGAGTKYCLPDFSVCCESFCTCIQCGWLDCGSGFGDERPPGCVSTPITNDDPACNLPNFDEFCRD